MYVCVPIRNLGILPVIINKLDYSELYFCIFFCIDILFDEFSLSKADIWSCKFKFKSSLLISLEIDSLYGL